MPFLNGSAKNNINPKGIIVINNHQPLAFRSCMRLINREKSGGIVKNKFITQQKKTNIEIYVEVISLIYPFKL